MRRSDVTIEHQPERLLFGLGTDSNEARVALDSNVLAYRYEKVTGASQAAARPFFVVSTDLDEASGDLRLFAGSPSFHDGLERFVLPAGRYAWVTVRPFLGWLWGPAIASATRRLTRTWPPDVGEHWAGVLYEHHTDKSVGWWPSLTVRALLVERDN